MTLCDIFVNVRQWQNNTNTWRSYKQRKQINKQRQHSKNWKSTLYTLSVWKEACPGGNNHFHRTNQHTVLICNEEQWFICDYLRMNKKNC